MQKNKTGIKEFILLGFGEPQSLHTFLFLIFLLIYIVTLIANFLTVLLIVTARHLHTPMYYFLGNLSCLEILYSSAILPKTMASFWTGDKAISLRGCMLQFYFFSFLVCTECYLLAVMSYDRFLAICKPLHYARIMDGKLCLSLAGGSWINSIVFISIYLPFMLELHYCGSNTIDHFYCESFALIKLSCSHIRILPLVTVILAFLFSFPPFLLTLISYVYIIHTILKIPSITGRQKAFSTCSSHLIVVCLFYGAIIIVISYYLIPKVEVVRDLSKMFSLLYTVFPPMANPLIYTLRNKDVKDILRKAAGKIMRNPV
ncbi:olfactory receptor 6B1-like [Varanus komodoensis]|uniref:olfactory receptor 6B1-like n=1 Tax=Varanus komodoensis TaxID=61221 RepID=UPI001CF7B743|nr:olfactory receptor 6B1-like [Varanus komodoensis]